MTGVQTCALPIWYLDEVRIWSRARTSEEIQRSYRCRLTGAEPGLEAYWHFEGGDGADGSGHGHDGSLFSGAAVVQAPAGLTLFPAPCPVDSRWPVPGPSGCVAWWSGDGTAADIQRTNHGTLQDGVAFEPGFVGEAFFLEGVDDYPLFGQDAAAVSVAAGPDLEFGPDSTFTLMAWVNTVLAPGNYPNGLGIYQMVIGKCDATDAWDWGIYIAPSGNVVASANGAASVTLIEPGIWYHLATTYSNGTHEIYVNGTLEGRNVSGPLITQSTGAVALGRKGESLQNQSFFKGLLDEVQVYSRVLAPEEIQAVSVSGAVGLCKAPRFTEIATDADWVLLRLVGQTEKTVEIQGVMDLPGWVSLLTLPNPTGAQIGRAHV